MILKNIFVFIGLPGGGKGSLSRLCIENLGWNQLSTGNLCRSHIAEQTEIGKKIDFIIKSGNLISDSIMTEMVSDWLSNNSVKPSVIFDGYPRTVVQAKALHDLLKTKFKGIKLNLVKLVVDESTVIKRLAARIVCSNKDCQAIYSTSTESTLIPSKSNTCDKCSCLLIKRSDDQESTIIERLSIYNKHEKELLEFYSNLGENILEVDAQRPIEEVFKDFKKVIN